MSRPEEDLACAIARHHFGPIVGEVVRLLLLQPGSTVSTLVTESESFFYKHFSTLSFESSSKTTTSPLSIIQSTSQQQKQSKSSSSSINERVRLIRDSLAVLIQHDLAFAREVFPPTISKPISSTTPVPFEYFIFIDKLMCRIRIPLYIGFARLRFGSVGDIVLRTLFQRGRLTSQMMFSIALDKALPKLGVSTSEAEACLTDMARCGLLRWSCRRSSLQKKKSKKNNNAHGNGNVNTTAKVGEKRCRAGSNVKVKKSIEIVNGNGSDADDEGGEANNGRKRPSSDDNKTQANSSSNNTDNALGIDFADSESDSESDSDSDSDNSDNDDDNENSHGHGQRVIVGRGDSRRKVGTPKRDNDCDIWTICYWHLNREFRNECCVKVAQSRVQDVVACSVLRIGLQLALEEEDCNRPSEDFESADINVEDIQKILEQRDGSLSASTFWEAIQTLVNETPPFVIPIPEHAPTKLRFIPGRLIAEARQKTMEEILSRRYTPVGRRVFQALAMDGGMEEKMLADKCMLHVKVVRALVYKLYEDDLVCVQEVSRSYDVQQRSSNWYYLWTVNLLKALRNVVIVMYKTLLNLLVRLEALDEKEAKEGWKQRRDEGEKRKIEAQRDVVVGNILRIDQSIMVMRDFGPLTASYFPCKYTMLDGPVGIVKKRR